MSESKVKCPTCNSIMVTGERVGSTEIYFTCKSCKQVWCWDFTTGAWTKIRRLS